MMKTLTEVVSNLQEFTPLIGIERQQNYTPMLLTQPEVSKPPSALDRRVLIEIEHAISAAATFTLFEFNDELTRAQFLELINPFLENLQNHRRLKDFIVVCDETNNHPNAVQSNNQFVADIYIKPDLAVNYIVLNFIANWHREGEQTIFRSEFQQL